MRLLEEGALVATRSVHWAAGAGHAVAGALDVPILIVLLLILLVLRYLDAQPQAVLLLRQVELRVALEVVAHAALDAGDVDALLIRGRGVHDLAVVHAEADLVDPVRAVGRGVQREDAPQQRGRAAGHQLDRADGVVEEALVRQHARVAEDVGELPRVLRLRAHVVALEDDADLAQQVRHPRAREGADAEGVALVALAHQVLALGHQRLVDDAGGLLAAAELAERLGLRDRLEQLELGGEGADVARVQRLAVGHLEPAEGREGRGGRGGGRGRRRRSADGTGSRNDPESRKSESGRSR